MPRPGGCHVHSAIARSGTRAFAREALQSAYRGGVSALDPALCSASRQAASAGHGGGGGRGLSVAPGHRGARFGFDAESVAGGIAVPLSRGARRRAAVDGGHRAREASRSIAGGSHRGRGARVARAVGGHALDRGELALQLRDAAPRRVAAAGQGHRFRAARDHGARRQGECATGARCSPSG